MLLGLCSSTLTLALLWPIRPLFHVGLWVNRLFIRLALLLDRICGIRSLYPTNFVAVAVKGPLTGPPLSLRPLR